MIYINIQICNATKLAAQCPGANRGVSFIFYQKSVMQENDKFETALMAKLEKGGLDKIALKKVSSSIVGLKNKGLVIDQVHIKGKPGFSRVLINGTIDPEFWRKFGGADIPFRTFEVFPYGILNPEGFRFQGVVESY